jgi:hypothetical protein
MIHLSILTTIFLNRLWSTHNAITCMIPPPPPILAFLDVFLFAYFLKPYPTDQTLYHSQQQFSTISIVKVFNSKYFQGKYAFLRQIQHDHTPLYRPPLSLSSAEVLCFVGFVYDLFSHVFFFLCVLFLDLFVFSLNLISILIYGVTV